ncbi:MAG: hypothetical protein KDA36_12230, partial [Planctomycetaceae bacterium]|nr:hypothetical protein [Planctomycetaceae bacterium]
ASYYYRALALLNEQEKLGKELIEITEIVEKLGNDNKQLSEFPAERVRTFLGHCSSILRELETAAACEKCDWGVEVRLLSTREAIELVLPEIQNSRNLARIVVLKARLAIVERKYEEAFSAIQTGFQLGHDVGKFPTLISSLVGMAITSISTQPLMELISEPNSANYYWAAASVPKPFFDVISPVEYECSWALKIPLLQEAEKSHTPEEWKRLLAEAFQFRQQMYGTSSLNSEDGSDTNTQVDLLQHVLREYPRAKGELARLGFTADQVESMPVIQVIALHDARLIPHKRDDLLRWVYQPYWQSAERVAAIDRRPVDDGESKRLADMKESLGLFEILHPAVAQVLHAFVRPERRFVRVLAIEALRMQAFENEGKFPEKLSELRAVPIPNDPVTGNPIIYRLDGETAVLEFPPPESQKIGSYGETIRLTLRKSP